MLFNKLNNGSSEIHDLVGSFYANNDFSTIQSNILLETKTIQSYVGKEVIKRADDYYNSTSFSVNGEEIDDKLVQALQLPIASMAVFRYSQERIISHEDSGRKFKIDNENEKMPWEWMYDRDDAAMLRKAYLAIDLLIDFLEENEIEEWMESDNRNRVSSLFISSCREFNSIFPIDESERFYYTLTPFIKEAQIRFLPQAIGEILYAELLDEYKSSSVTDKRLLELIQFYLPLRTIEIACNKLSVSVFPEGVVQRFLSNSQGRKSANIAPQEAIRNYSKIMKEEADTALNDIKKHIQLITADKLNYPLLPNNENKGYFRA